MPKLSTLELIKTYRPGEQYPGGGGKTHRDYYDFIIDGFPLSELARKHDLISCLSIPIDKWVIEAVKRLLLAVPADFPDNRRSLYICPECGDLGCGAISLIIEADNEIIIWREFAYQNNSDDTLHLLPDFDALGEFRFDRTEYDKLLRSVIEPSE